MSNDQSSQGDPVGCLIAIVVIVACFILAVFFPVTRGGALVQPIVQIWESLLGIPLPSYNIGPIILKGFILLFFTVVSFIGGLSIARFLNRRYYGIDLNLQTVGAIASILGLLIGIMSLILKR